MTQTDPNPTKPLELPEELQIAGEQLLARIKELAREGAVRRIRIKRDERVILEIPLAVGLVGAALYPTFAALSTMGALIAQCSIEVVRVERPSPEQPSPVS